MLYFKHRNLILKIFSLCSKIFQFAYHTQFLGFDSYKLYNIMLTTKSVAGLGLDYVKNNPQGVDFSVRVTKFSRKY